MEASHKQIAISIFSFIMSTAQQQQWRWQNIRITHTLTKVCLFWPRNIYFAVIMINLCSSFSFSPSLSDLKRNALLNDRIGEKANELQVVCISAIHNDDAFRVLALSLVQKRLSSSHGIHYLILCPIGTIYRCKKSKIDDNWFYPMVICYFQKPKTVKTILKIKMKWNS